MIRPKLLGIGGAHIDRRGTMAADYIYGASVPGQIMEEAGGGVFNALRTACQFDVNCAMLSVRGGDAAGDAVAAEMKRAGILDLSAVFLDRTTASYTALLTRDGDVIAALADMSIYETALPRQISRSKTRAAIQDSDAILIDANMPEDGISRLLQRCVDKPVYALAVSPAKAVRLRAVLSQLTCLFLNHSEAKAILAMTDNDAPVHSLDLTQALKKIGVKRCVLTDGSDHVCVLDGASISMIAPPKTDLVVDVTGAGDAMAGATIAALLAKADLWNAVQTGLAAATVTVETRHASADFSDLRRFNQLRAQMKPQ
jgi:pseudouridine kinase